MIGAALSFLTTGAGRAVLGAALAAVIVGGAYMKGRSDGSDACETRWERKVEDARMKRDEERRAAAEALSMQALEFAETESVLRERAQETANALDVALEKHRALIELCEVPDELLAPFR